MKSGSNTKPIYFNAVQQKVMFIAANKTTIVGGRRIGKSHGIAAPWLQRNFQRMPRSSGAVVGSSYQQLLTRTLPGTITALEKIGFVRNKHFFIGRRPPKSAGFVEPYISPESWDYVISFYNGSILHLISQDREGTSNSFTLDYLLIDEAKLANFEKLKSETFPANGGYRGYFGNCPWHHSMLIISDMPTTKKGSWFLNYKDECDNELIECIEGLVYEIWKMENKVLDFKKAGTEVPAYLKSYIRKLHKTLSEFRAVASYYEEFSSIENLQVLGENYIKQMKRDLPPLVFQTSILCKRIGALTDGFYSALKESVHYYTNFNNSFLDSLDYDFAKAQSAGSLQDGDLMTNEPVCIAMDYNANINWLVAGQQMGNRMNVIKSFFVKYERKLEELVDDFCEYYQHKQLKEVVYYYDTTALGSNYAVNSDDFAMVVINRFRRCGWNVVPVMIGNPLPHKEKHLLINRALKGQGGLIPYFNKSNNEALLLAMEQTGIRLRDGGFKKEKGGEKYKESEEDKLEHRTDGTDAFDTLFMGMNKFPHYRSNILVSSSFL